MKYLKCFCGWKGYESKLVQKSFGAYSGDNDDYDSWGWEEWENMACPNCGREVDYLDEVDVVHEFKMALLHDHPFGKFLKFIIRKIPGIQLKKKYRK